MNVEPKNYCEDARVILRSLGRLHEKELSRDELLRKIGEYDVLIARFGYLIDGKMISAGKRLKIIASATTGARRE